MKKRKLLLLLVPVIVLFSIIFWNQKASVNYYLDIMGSLSKEETKAALREKFHREYNLTELVRWVNEHLVFDENLTKPRYEDPFCILGFGKGRCGEFSILYVAVCLAHGYESRLVIAVDISNPFCWSEKHAWAEVKVNDAWVHVDPSDKKWDEPYRYETWEWGKHIGSTVRIYAFEDGRYEDVTLNYKRKD